MPGLPPPGKETLADKFLSIVDSRIGDPYVWGATGPNAFDCSGLIYWAAKQAGIRGVPRTTTEQWSALKHVPVSDVQPGDLVYFTGADPPSPGHVGVVDKSGTTWSMIDAPQTGMDVSVQSFAVPGQGDGHIVGFARLPGVSGKGGTGSGGGGGTIFSWPGEITGFFSEAERFVQAAMWLANPENWVRILAGIAGAVLGIAGVLFLMKAA